MTPIEARLLDPAPEGPIAAARDFGIDLSLLVERLRRTPEQRLRDLQALIAFYEQIRGAARRTHGRPPETADGSRRT